MTLRAVLAFAFTFATAGLAQEAYTIDPAHSSAQFSVRHMMISNVKGEFSKVSGTVVYDPANLAASRVEAVIDASSLNTRVEQRDKHLKSADFFDVEKYPTLTFRSKQITKASGKLLVKGDLTMHGVTREVTLEVEGPSAVMKDPMGNLRLGASATTTINRKDWGLTWNKALEGGGVLVGEDIAITLDIEAFRKAASAARQQSRNRKN
jgi:polyisoprenoid-binding protein YceI